MDIKYDCFMSEYDAPHKSILEIEKLKLYNNSLKTKTVAIEKLYYNEIILTNKLK